MTDSLPLSRQVDRHSVTLVVQRFYHLVLADPLLAPHFSAITDWPAHEGHIVDFWWGLMGGQVEKPRPGAMVSGHRRLLFGHQELERWLELFTQTLASSLPSAPARQWAELARQLGERMTERDMLQR